jgi:heme-degrading monooxygenase HmoA
VWTKLDYFSVFLFSFWEKKEAFERWKENTSGDHSLTAAT